MLPNETGPIQGDGDNTTGAADAAAPLLALKQLDKRFGATHALKAVDLCFEDIPEVLVEAAE